MSSFENFKKELPSKEKFYGSLKSKKISDKQNEHVSKVQDRFKMKTVKDYYDLYLKYDILLLADEFGKIRKGRLKNYGYVRVII